MVADGAFCILDRLKKAVNEPLYRCSYNLCMKCAIALEDETWENNLKMPEKDS